MARIPSRERKVYTLRLGSAERRLLEAAAEKKRVYLSEFIRESSLRAARRDLEIEQPTEAAVSLG